MSYYVYFVNLSSKAHINKAPEYSSANPGEKFPMPEPLTLQLLGLLSDDELAKVERIRSSERREKSLWVRALVRILLSRHSDIAPQQWRFEYGKHGKPRLTDAQFKHSGISFNLSHSGDWFMIAIACMNNPNQLASSGDCQPIMLGADIERLRSRTDIHAILNNYFSELEITQLQQLPESEQRQRFFDLWALKESFIKAEGSGLALSLKSFAFDFRHVVSSKAELQTLENTVNESTENESTANESESIHYLPTLDGIGLEFDDAKLGDIKKTNLAKQKWQVQFGYLNQEYRFAITSNIAGKTNWQFSLVDKVQLAQMLGR
ncbi:4'-phosphopantetheinyl transferase family protein [Shewanella maritima]|nr:4'-phosphopantetheinyl transferase superfamily protein [Shewanella maritima]